MTILIILALWILAALLVTPILTSRFRKHDAWVDQSLSRRRRPF